MPRIPTLELDQATGKAADLMTGVQKATGRVPNILKTMAHAPALFEAYMGFSSNMKKSSLSPALREQIALTVAAIGDCDYCIDAHAFMGRKTGLEPDEMALALKAESTDAKSQAALTFAKLVVDSRGWVDDDDLRALLDAGYTHGQALEIVGVVVLNLLTNYVNHLAHTESDFPKADLPVPA
jgi:uncharacterized peroxidase-related enzyme